MRVLLVNPWIADVSAYNFWVRPLGLYALAEWLWARGCDVSLVDCLSPNLAPGRFRRVPVSTPIPLQGFPRRFCRYGIEPEEFRKRLLEKGPFDAALLTSAMAYWYPGVQWAVSELRRQLPGVPIGLGGLYPTLWEDHARVHSGADRVFCGALEDHGNTLASFLGVSSKPLREANPWYQLGLHDGASYAAVRTAQGCPYRCTYCAADRIHRKYSPRGPADVFEEIRSLRRLGVTDIAFYDDALLVDFETRVAPVLHHIADEVGRPRYHTPNGLHARLVTKQVASSLVRSGFATVRLGLETLDGPRQTQTGGKVRRDEVARAVHHLRNAGMDPGSIGVYLMVGLLGQTLSEVEASVRFVRSLGVRPHLSEFSPIPGTLEWDRLTEAGAIPSDLDPLLTNNTVFVRRSGSYSLGELERSLLTWRRSLPPPASASNAIVA